MKAQPIVAGVLISIPAVLVLLNADAQRSPSAPRSPPIPPPPITDIPPPWEIEFTLHDQARRSANGQVVTRTTDYKGIKYSVRALPGMTVEPSRLDGEFKQLIDVQGPGSAHSDQVWSGPRSATKTLPEPAWKPGQHELLLGRRVDIEQCKGILEPLNAWTPGSRNMPSNGKADHFALSANLSWTPTNWKATVYTPKGPQTVTVPPMSRGGAVMTLPEFEVPYDFSLLTNNNNGATYSLPPYSFGGFRTVKRTVNFTITRKPMWIEYGDPKVSLIGQLPSCKTCTDQYPNYARGEETGILESDGSRYTAVLRFIHGNVDLHLFIDGRDVTNYKTIDAGQTHRFELLRLRRDWRWPLDEGGNLTRGRNGQIAGGIALPTERSTRQYGNGWFDDDPSLDNFKDMPGNFQDGPPSTWTPERETKEFLVSIKGFPEFGFYYYSITIEKRPGQYRIGQSRDAAQLKAAEWCGRLVNSSAQPFEIAPFDPWVSRFFD